MSSNTNTKGTASATNGANGSLNKDFTANEAFRQWCTSNGLPIDADSWYRYQTESNDPDIKTEIVQDKSLKVEVTNQPTTQVTPETIKQTSQEHIDATNAKVADMNATNNAQQIVAAQNTPTQSNNHNTTTNTTPNNTSTVQNKDKNTSSGMKTYSDRKQKRIDKAQAKIDYGKGLGWMEVGDSMSAGIQTIGRAFGAQQAATDSDTTKNITAVWDGAATMDSKFGPVGKAIGSVMSTMGAAGNILQAITGGTDQVSKTDQWMASPLLSWNVGWINDNWGEKSKAFQADQNIIAQVGSSYGGSVSDITKAASESDKKFGLFSKKDRQKANEASDAALAKQNAMGEIADSARDQRLSVQSMGEQAGLAYSMLTSGGYNQKYTYAAKRGGLLESHTDIESEWKPQIELNWELPLFKEGGSVEFVKELEQIPEFESGGKSEEYPKEYLEFKESLPDNQRNTSEYDYRTYLYCQLWGKPKNFQYTLEHPDESGNYMYTWDNSDNSYHASTIAWKDGVGYFMKPKHHSTLKYELDWYNKGLITEEGGKQREMTPEERKEWEEFKSNYELVDDGDFYKYIPKNKKGGSLGDADIPEIEETTQKNVIPEGALHKNKHHMEHAEGLTKKGIPVVDEDGEQQAEIEHSEIIFTLEVTKKLEEYYEIFYSEESTNKQKEQAALDAGKLLVYQILENTEDRTGLIESCKKGGTLTFKKDTEELIEEVLEWMPTVVIVETEEPKKESKKEEQEVSKKDVKDGIKDIIREVLIELLVK